jgi:hypothetical protein
MYVGLEISDKKNYSREDKNSRNNWFVPAKFRLFRRTDNSRNDVPNHSAEEKKAWNSVPWNKNIGKFSKFPSELFPRRENNSKFRSVEQKEKQTLGIPF